MADKKKMNSRAIMVGIVAPFVLCGCAKDNISAVVDSHIKQAEEVIDFARNNMGDDPDTMLLINALNSCKVGLEDTKYLCEAEVRAEKNNTAYWKLACGVLVGILVALGYLFIRVKV